MLNVDDFPEVPVPGERRYRLVDEGTLKSLLAFSQWLVHLKIPPDGLPALGFAIRHFRQEKNLSVLELSNMTGISRAQLAQIEEAKLKRRPHAKTLLRLAEVLGDDFRLVTQLLESSLDRFPAE